MLEKMTGMADGKARALARAHQAEATAQVSSLSALFTCVSCFSFSFFPPLGPRASAIVCTHALHRKQLVHFLSFTCMYACVYVCENVCTHVCMCVSMYVCMYACMHVCVYVWRPQISWRL